MGLRIVSGLVLSDRLLRPDLPARGEIALFGKPGTDTQISWTGKCAVCSVAPVGPLYPRGSPGGLPDAASRTSRGASSDPLERGCPRDRGDRPALLLGAGLSRSL